MKRLIHLLILLGVSAARAQSPVSEQGVLLSITYAAQLPAADLANDFGYNFNAGLDLQYMTKSKFIFGINANYLFGNKIKNDVLTSLKTPEGEIIGQDREYAFVSVDERGFFVGGEVGKIIPVGKANPNSGLRLAMSAGILQHKHRIDDKNAQIPQLAGDYIKGYDRNTWGAALSQFIGYQYLSKDKQINCYAGFELVQGFTRNRRSWDFPTQTVLDQPRLDLLHGIRVGWILPFYQFDSTEEIFY